jgi:hypothetical protein
MRQLHVAIAAFSFKRKHRQISSLVWQGRKQIAPGFQYVERITLSVSSVAMLSNEEMCRGGVQFTPIAATFALLFAHRTHSAKSSPPQVVLSVVRVCLISCYRRPLSYRTSKGKLRL